MFSFSFFNNKTAAQLKVAQRSAKTHLSGGGDVASDELHPIGDSVAIVLVAAYKIHGVKAVDAAIKAAFTPPAVKSYTAAEIAAMGY